MANKHIKSCPTLLVIREMLIKITRYHLTPVRMIIIKRQEITSAGEDMEKRKPVHCWWECKFGDNYGKQYGDTP